MSKPLDWQSKSLGSVCKVKGGFAFKSSDYLDDGIPLIRISNVGKGFFTSNNLVFLSEKDYINKIEFQVKSGDILMGMTGDLGKICRISKDDLPALLNQRVGSFFPLESFNKDFLYYVVNSNSYLRTLAIYFTGGAQANISTRQLESIEIEYPSNYREQEKIAEILAKIDTAIKLTESSISKQERVKKGLMQDLLTRGIDENGNIRSEETHKFKDSELGRIPEEWDMKTLGELAPEKNIVAGPFGSNLKTSDYRDSGVPLLRLQNIKKDRFIDKDIKYISTEKAEQLNYHSFIGGDIAMAKLGDNIGESCIIPKSFNYGIVVADVVRIRINENKLNKFFLLRAINFDNTLSLLRKELIGSTRQRVNLGEIRELLIALPIDKSEQDKIAEILNKEDTIINAEKTQLSKLQKIKSGLMQDLLTGKVRVDNLLLQ